MNVFAAQRSVPRLLCMIFLVSLIMVSTASVSAQDVPGVNDQPDITLQSPAPDTTPGVSVSVSAVVSDPDVGAGNMELEIDISDLDGIGGLSTSDYGTFSWGLGTNVTSDVEVTTMAALNAALTTFTFNPGPGFAGTARIIFEIDDQGNTGSGGVLSRTRFIDIDVCAPSELGSAACAVNNQPDVTLPGTQNTPINTPITFTVSVSDVDVGTWDMEMEIDISDLDGIGGLSVPAGDYGTFTWGFGTNVTSDVQIDSMAGLNTALLSFTYTPDAGFTGMARIIFEIDDQGNSGEESPKNVLSRTRFIDINVGTATNTPTPTNTAADTATPTSTPTDTTVADTATPTNTATDTPVGDTATPTSTPTDTVAPDTATPTATDTGVVVSTDTPTSTATIAPERLCLVTLPVGAVQGRMKASALAFWAPDPSTMTTVLLPAGSSWFIINEENGFYELWIACQANPVWIPIELLEPNYDAVWQGAPLP